MRKGKTDWNKVFPVIGISREDLVTAGYPRWEAALATVEMERLCSHLKATAVQTFSLADLESAMDVIRARHAGVEIIGGIHDHTAF